MAEPALLGKLNVGDKFRLSPEDGEVLIVTGGTGDIDRIGIGMIGAVCEQSGRRHSLYYYTRVYPLPPEQEKPPSTRLTADLIRLLEEWEPADD